MERRELLRLLGQATLLALLVLGAEDCGGGKHKTESHPTPMPSNTELASRLDTVRRLLDDADQKRLSVADPLAAANLATQIAIGNAVLVLAERVSELAGIHSEMSSAAGSLSDINNHARNMDSSLDSISRQ